MWSFIGSERQRQRQRQIYLYKAPFHFQEDRQIVQLLLNHPDEFYLSRERSQNNKHPKLLYFIFEKHRRRKKKKKKKKL